MFIFFSDTPNLPYCSLFLGPNMCEPLDFRKLESPFPKDSSYQIWFWRSRLKETYGKWSL